MTRPRSIQDAPRDSQHHLQTSDIKPAENASAMEIQEDNQRDAERPINRNYVSGACCVTSVSQMSRRVSDQDIIFDYRMTVRFCPGVGSLYQFDEKARLTESSN